MRPALPAAELGQKNVALSPKGRHGLLERPHPVSDIPHAELQLGFIEPAEVVGHGMNVRP